MASYPLVAKWPPQLLDQALRTLVCSVGKGVVVLEHVESGYCGTTWAFRGIRAFSRAKTVAYRRDAAQSFAARHLVRARQPGKLSPLLNKGLARSEGGQQKGPLEKVTPTTNSENAGFLHHSVHGGAACTLEVTDRFNAILPCMRHAIHGGGLKFCLQVARKHIAHVPQEIPQFALDRAN